ncbi:MAG: FtsK/SpoIIIE domain-containing protein, partial [Actinomycetota bacterium]
MTLATPTTRSFAEMATGRTRTGRTRTGRTHTDGASGASTGGAGDDTVPGGADSGRSGRSGTDEQGTGCTVEIVTGPDRRTSVRLTRRRFVVGRDPGSDLAVDDASLAAHQLLVDLDPLPGSLGDTALDPPTESDDVAATKAAAVHDADRHEPSAGGGRYVRLVPLSGPSRLQVGDRPVESATLLRWPDADGTASSPLRLRLGATDLTIRRDARRSGRHHVSISTPRRVPREESSDGRWVVRRTFEPRPPAAEEPITPPPPLPEVAAPPTTPLTGAVTGLAGAIVVAGVLGSVVFVVFAAVAATIAVGTYLTAWACVRRRRRADRATRAAALLTFEGELSHRRRVAIERLRTAHPGVTPALDTIADPDLAEAPWSRRHLTGCVDVVVGIGARRWRPPVAARSSQHPDALGGDADVDDRVAAASVLDEVPLTVPIAAGRALAVCGPAREAVVRSLLVQLAWIAGPVDVEASIVTDRPAWWDWAAVLPQLCGDDGPRVLRTSDLGGAFGTGASPQSERPSQRRLRVVVVDATAPDAANGGVRAAAGDDAAVIVLAPEPPAWVDEAIVVGALGSIDHRRDHIGDESVETISGRAIGITDTTARSIAGFISRHVDPEFADSTRLPASVSLTALHRAAIDIDPSEPTAIAEHWRAAGTDPPLVAALGTSIDGCEVVDLVADGPHGLVARTTGSGKSELLRSLVVGLAIRSPPDAVSFLLVDYKGGSAFDACASLPHVAGLVTDLDEGLAERAVLSLEAELRDRERLLRAVGAEDLTTYRRGADDGRQALPRLVVVVDEFAALARELPEFLAALVDVARRGRSLGVHLVLATQRPGGVIGDDLRANTALRISLRVTSASESTDVIGSGEAAALPASRPGRALRWRPVGPAAPFQCASGRTLGPDGRTELARVVGALGAAATLHGAHRPRSPWTPPLPDRIEYTDLQRLLDGDGGAAGDRAGDGSGDGEGDRAGDGDGAGDGGRDADDGVLGVLDDPIGRTRRPLRWRPSDGSLVIVGGVGSGATSTLRTLVAAGLGADDGPGGSADTPIVVIDARRDEQLDALARLERCLGVIRLTEIERLRRALARAATGEPLVMFVDGLDTLRATLRNGPDPSLEQELVDVVMNASVRDVCVVATTREGPGSLLAAFRHVWVGAVDEPSITRSLGWVGPPVPRRPGRVGVVGEGLLAHLVAAAPRPAAPVERPGSEEAPATIRALPERIDRSTLLASIRREVATPTHVDAAPASGLVVGLDADSGAPDGLDMPPGAHLLVVGRPRSGVSTTLRSIAAAWRERHGAHSVVIHGGSGGDD